MFVAMTIHEASRQLRFQLFHLYDEREAGNITELVMEHLTGWKKIDRVINKTVPLSASQEQLLQQYTSALLIHRPLQYILQQAWFYGLSLYVDENVLIPRPETEELVDWLIKDARQAGRKTDGILDIGTGSGCIALAIKKNLPLANMHACDISEPALLVAKKNADIQKQSIHFHLLDILSLPAREALPAFDIMVSNPPYIPAKDKKAMSQNVLQYEPHLALFVEDADPLLFYKTIAAFAKTHLKKDGFIYLEIHEDMAIAVIPVFQQYGYTHIELKKDLQEKDRMVKVSF